MNKTVEMKEDYIVLSIPRTSLELTITAKVYFEGDLMEVTKHMDANEIYDAFQDARNNYIPEDAVFSITGKGKRWLEEQGLAEEEDE